MTVSYRRIEAISASDFLCVELLKRIKANEECEFNARAMLRQWMKAHQTIKQKDVASFIRDVLDIFQTELIVRGLRYCVTAHGHKVTWEKLPPRQPLRAFIYCEGNPCHHCHHWPESDACIGCPHSPYQRFGNSDD